VRVAVIGGGVVGLCTALAVARTGAEVVVVDRGPSGETPSHPNAGWVVPALAAPLSGPGVLPDTLRQVLRREAAFAVHPAPSLDLLRWTWGFLRSGTPRRHEAGLRAMLALGARSVDQFARLREDGVDFEMHRTGLLLAARREEGVQHSVALARAAADAGYRGTFEELSGDAIREREPALAPGVAGGVHARDEGHVRPESLMRGLSDALAARGAAVRRGCDVRSIEPAGAGRWRLLTPASEHVADRVVVAAGVWSGALLAGLGVRVPVLPAKGYSVTASGSGRAPRHALKLVEANVACSPFADGVRLAGMFELGRRGARVPGRRVDRVVRLASSYLHDWTPTHARAESAGLRPATPDSLPLVGEVPGCPGVFAATGHGMLGVTLAPATAEALAPLVVRGQHDPVLAPFGPGRFGRRAGGKPPGRPAVTRAAG
jgi:D-amino-acid dehydrogenase